MKKTYIVLDARQGVNTADSPAEELGTLRAVDARNALRRARKLFWPGVMVVARGNELDWAR